MNDPKTWTTGWGLPEGVGAVLDRGGQRGKNWDNCNIITTTTTTTTTTTIKRCNCGHGSCQTKSVQNPNHRLTFNKFPNTSPKEWQ